MHAVATSLSRILSHPGVVGVSLVDAVTGLCYGSVGDSAARGSAELSELTTLIGDRLHEAGDVGELESIVVTSARRHHIVQVVPGQHDGLLLTATLDRERTNLALAVRLVSDSAKDVLA